MAPNKTKLFPSENIRTVCYIQNLPPRSNVDIGDYTYYSDNTNPPEHFYDRIQHHYDFIGDRLVIGKFCAIAEGVTFIMNGANHRMEGMTTYPFNIFGGGWERVTPTLEQLPYKGDTVLGNDVWLGQNVTIMPGITIGDGAIVASNSTVVKDIEPYTIVGGNPAKTVKKRFDEETIALLLELKWWDQDEEWLDAHLECLVSTYDLQILRELLNSK
ncbi:MULTISPECIES: Vat family streptogramin A O-acetyltransferase [unclassified Paenibacillus]|uniref:Vat family streptogramin A O-acetyltransferase n=1 Tax=unclassified Paenibacillus TaxID=185978 RepID=UPI001784877C|nr:MULTISPECIES: Vat family streptogramin A O-acetyltransferase [unclassified Paenibacillus]MBD8838532.1 Vat family streptogramin A O-acetyltransferase [Paenibacillus sp. CFBP 13594]QZN78097.1 Vat family streptogramin A O-acetyltransferase [Paenibacillus sp. DR312]